MHIPMVVREPTVRVYATIPAGQADALKALAEASGVPVARAVHYAVERLLDAARKDGAGAVTGALAPAAEPDAGDGAVAEVAQALGLRVPDPEPGVRDPGGGDGQFLLEAPREPDGVRPEAQPALQDRNRETDRGGVPDGGRETDLPAAPAAAPVTAPVDGAERAAAV